jgi:hypothetical protein
MLFGNDRDQMRRYFCEVWRKRETGSPLEPLERIIAEIIVAHPEYHSILSDPDAAAGRDYPVEAGATNPFLHMSMHIAIQEQLLSDRPTGVRDIYRSLRDRYGDEHATEHHMMECLAETLWEAQRSGTAPDESFYLRRLQRLAQRH